MYRTIADFTKDWTIEARSTEKLFDRITNESLDQRIYSEGRELGRLAVHLIETPHEMLHTAGLPIGNGSHEPLPSPKSASGLSAQYHAVAEEAAEVVRNNWTDSSLTESVEMYGQPWTKGEVLNALILHQTHHRGQLTVLMRQAGLIVPGMYGPAREEWAAMGMPALA